MPLSRGSGGVTKLPGKDPTCTATGLQETPACLIGLRFPVYGFLYKNGFYDWRLFCVCKGYPVCMGWIAKVFVAMRVLSRWKAIDGTDWVMGWPCLGPDQLSLLCIRVFWDSLYSFFFFFLSCTLLSTLLIAVLNL